MKPSANRGVPAFIMRIRDHKVFAPLHGQGLKALAFKGSVWTIIGFGIQKIIQLSSNLILTRLLFPEAFGTMALVLVFIVGLAMFSDLGIRPAIIQNERGEDPNFLNTAWTIQVIRGFALWIVACLIAWPLSQLYDQPILFPILSFVGITAVIQGFQSTALATRNRDLQLGLLTLLPILSQVASISVMVLLAWMYQSIWALAIGSVVGALASTFLSHLMLPSRRHRFHIEPEAFKTLLNFGKWIFLATLLGYFGGHGIRAIQGLLVTPADLGIIYIASMFAWAIGDLTQSLTATVGFPVLAQIARNEPQKLRMTLAQIRLRLFAMALPVFILLSLSSELVINTLYDQRYAAAGHYLAILSLTEALTILSTCYFHAFLATGNSKTTFIITLVAAICRTSGLVVGFQLAGIEGMLIGLGAGTLLLYFFNLFLAHRFGWLSPLLDSVALAIIFIAAILTYYWNFMPG